MFHPTEKPGTARRALLVGVQRPQMPPGEADALLHELKELVETLGIEAAIMRAINLREPQSKFLIGSGRAAELTALAKEQAVDLIVFDDELTPAQQRNWEQDSGIRTIDRQEVILDIFGRRARTREAMLQVELARMVYSLPRLKRAWMHLSRQRGGGSTVVRGAGETQLETDHRLVQARISRLRRELDLVIKQREIQRKRRLRNDVHTAAIVGYTNVGKSSLLNALTGSNVIAENKLFVTLDPTTRQLHLQTGQKVLVTDTVGFVRRLPHGLIDAFRATLEEAVISDFMIHVLDIGNPEVEKHHTTTIQVLNELGASSKNIITVFNKVDAEIGRDRLNTLRVLYPEACFISARTGEGLAELTKRIEMMVATELTSMNLLIPHSRYDLVSRLHRLGCVRAQATRDDGVFIQGHMPPEIAEAVHPFIIAPQVLTATVQPLAK